jgi:hypothetical protein
MIGVDYLAVAGGWNALMLDTVTPLAAKEILV